MCECVHAYEHVYDHVYAWSCMFYVDVHVYVHVFYRNNLHIVLCMSPVGNAFRTRCRMFPSLVNCCTIDWFVEWPREALLGVSKSFFESIDLGSDEIKVGAFLSNFWDLKEKANWFWMIALSIISLQILACKTVVYNHIYNTAPGWYK